MREKTTISDNSTPFAKKAINMAALNPDEVKQMKLGDYFDLQLFADVQIGTPTQKAKVIVDTGSDWFWVNSSECADCGGRNLFQAQKSETLEYDVVKLPKNLNENVKIVKQRSLFYGSGAIFGPKAFDKVCLTQPGVKKNSTVCVDKLAMVLGEQ